MALTAAGNVLIRFRNGDARWIDLKLFDFAAGASDADLLTALVAHPHLRDGYIGGPPSADPSAVHGPYPLDAVTPDRYKPIDAAEATAWLDDFCSLDGVATPAALAGDIDAVARRRIGAAGAVYRLSLPDIARHEVGWVLTEFRELVTIRRDAPELALAVLGID